MFCKANKDSIELFFDSLKMFSDASGLVANSDKSTMFLAGISPRVKEEISNHFLFPISKLPFKYLGVSLSSKRISKADCDLLVDKKTSRI